MIYYKHYIGDYQSKTGHLSLAQDGAYRRLMDHYYSTESPLPISLDSLYRICGAIEKKEREAVEFVIRTFFFEIDGMYHHDRIDQEVGIAQVKIEKLRENGKLGGLKSGAKRSSKKEANASAEGEAKTNISQKSKVKSQLEGLKNIILPEWLPEDSWNSWIEYRESIKAKLTVRAAELCIAKLTSLHEQGQDASEVIEQSIMSGKWTGLFPVKKDKVHASGNGSMSAAGQRTWENGQAWLESGNG